MTEYEISFENVYSEGSSCRTDVCLTICLTSDVILFILKIHKPMVPNVQQLTE